MNLETHATPEPISPLEALGLEYPDADLVHFAGQQVLQGQTPTVEDLDRFLRQRAYRSFVKLGADLGNLPTALNDDDGLFHLVTSGEAHVGCDSFWCGAEPPVEFDDHGRYAPRPKGRPLTCLKCKALRRWAAKRWALKQMRAIQAEEGQS